MSYTWFYLDETLLVFLSWDNDQNSYKENNTQDFVVIKKKLSLRHTINAWGWCRNILSGPEFSWPWNDLGDSRAAMDAPLSCYRAVLSCWCLVGFLCFCTRVLGEWFCGKWEFVLVASVIMHLFLSAITFLIRASQTERLRLICCSTCA